MRSSQFARRDIDPDHAQALRHFAPTQLRKQTSDKGSNPPAGQIDDAQIDWCIWEEYDAS
jgi:hypothetical protein